MLSKKLNILLIEDNHLEFNKLQNKIFKDKSDFSILHAINQKEAFSILKETFPNIIMLDINMTNINALDFLSTLKNDENYKHIPVIILSDVLDNESKILAYYKLSIGGYITKSKNPEDYEIKIKKLIDYWSLNEFINS